MKHRQQFVPDFNRRFARPPHVRVQRAKVVILNGLKLILKTCTRCRLEFYGTETRATCDSCKSKRVRLRKR